MKDKEGQPCEQQARLSLSPFCQAISHPVPLPPLNEVTWEQSPVTANRF